MWASSFLLLTLTFLLAAITYYLGIMLVATPHFAKGLRKLGWQLMTDSTSAVMAVFILFGFLMIWNGVLNIIFPTQWCWGSLCLPFSLYNPFALSTAYVNAESWVYGQIGQATAVGVLLKSVVLGAQSINQLGIPGVWSPAFGNLLASWLEPAIDPWLGIVQDYIILLNVILIWTQFIGPPGNFWAVFVILGTFFYSWPGRVGRGAAAWLIATPIGMVVGFPFMPYFVDGLAGAIDSSLVNYLTTKVAMDFFKIPPSLDFTTVWSVLTLLANPVSLVILRLIFAGAYLFLMSELIAGIARFISGTGMPGAKGELGGYA